MQWPAAAPAVPSETLGTRPGSVLTDRHRPVRAARPKWSSLARVREGLSLSHRTPATPVAGRAQCALTKVHSVSSDILVWLASGLDARCVKKECGLVGLCMTFNFRLSRARAGVVEMRQDSSY